jgi:hypothetical protein
MPDPEKLAGPLAVHAAGATAAPDGAFYKLLKNRVNFR